MRRYRVLAAVSLLLLPTIVRALWYYRGAYRPVQAVSVPSFLEIEPPRPPLGPEPVTPNPSPALAGKVVVIDRAHSNQFQLPELEALTQALLAQGATLEQVSPGDEFEVGSFGDPNALFAFSSRSLETRLKYASAYMVVAPQSAFSDAEIQHIARFVDRGGRLLVLLDPTRAGSGIDIFGFVLSSTAQDVSSANPLLQPHDLSFANDYLYNVLVNEGNFRNVFLTPAESQQLTEGVSRVVFYAARSVTTRQGSTLLVGDDSTYSSRTDRGGALAAAALSPDGRVLAVGDLTFLTPPYNQVADNMRLVQNLTGFLLGGERQQDLTDLPYLFTRPVQVLTTPDFAVQAETLPGLRSLQASLTSRGLTLTLSADPTEGQDLLVMALYKPSEETKPYLASLGLVLPADHDKGKLDVPGFGELEPQGTGLLAVIREPDRTTLVLMADDRDSLATLLENVGSGRLDDCVFQGLFGVCKVGLGAGFGTGDEFDFDFNFDLSTEEPSVGLPEVPVVPTPTGP